MKILVVGGSRFIGKSMVETLVRMQQYDIYVLNRGTRDNNPYVNTIIADRYNETQMKESLRGIAFDYVIDISGLDAEAARNLLAALDISNLKKMVYLSSSAVYAYNKAETVKKESSEIGENFFWGEYGINKREAEVIYERFSQLTSIPCAVIRPPYVYGENNYARRESFVFDHLVRKVPIIIPESNNMIQFIYVNDLTLYMYRMLDEEIEGTEYFNVGDAPITMEEWIRNCSKVLEVTPIIYRYCGEEFSDSKAYFPFNNYDNVLDVTKIGKLRIKHTCMEDGLKEAYRWYLREKANIVFSDQQKANEGLLLNEYMDQLSR